MPRKESEAVLEGNGPVPHQEEFGSDQPTLADVYRIIKKLLDKSGRKLDDLRIKTGQQTPRLASAWRAPLQQFKRCVGIAFPRTRSIPTRKALPASVMTSPDLRHSLV